MNWVWQSLHHAAAMFWETLWALVWGFSLSAFLRVFFRKEQTTKPFGRAGLREVALATVFGAVSSSCSYAATATAKTLFKKGAALEPTLAFMFASTNLVLELGFVIWLLLGWTFLLAEHWWENLFITQGTGSARLIENAVVGPLIAVASFVCPIGNIPLASLLWSNGISFGGVISFIYADLIIIPLIFIYRKYYGAKAALYITAVLYVSLVVTGIMIDLLFGALGLIPAVRAHGAIAEASFQLNYTTGLDIAAILLSGWFVWVHFTRGQNEAATTSNRHL